MKIESNNVNTKVLGTYTIDYYYDIEDQHYVCQRYVFVTDNTPPYLELLPGLDTIQLGTTWIDGGIDIMDNYYTDTFTVTVEHQINTSVVGDYLVVYTVADEDGNENTIERMIHVVE